MFYSAGKEFIPLIWGADASDQPWHSDISDPVEDKYDTILGFNEPNRGFRGPDMSPEEAAAAWIEIQTLYPDKVSAIFVEEFLSMIAVARFL